jgi:hypothetical protein
MLAKQEKQPEKKRMHVRMNPGSGGLSAIPGRSLAIRMDHGSQPLTPP